MLVCRINCVTKNLNNETNKTISSKLDTPNFQTVSHASGIEGDQKISSKDYVLTKFTDSQNMIDASHNDDPGKFVHKAMSLKSAEPQLTFLERNIYMDSITWTPASLGGTIFQRFFPEHLIRNPVLATRLARYRYLRCGFEFTVVLNCAPTQFGKIMVRWVPAVSREEISTIPTEAVDRWQDLVAISALPGIDVIAPNAGTYSFKVPYTLPAHWYDLKDYGPTLLDADKVTGGLLRIAVVNPIVKSNENDIDPTITIWAAMTDVELCMPTFEDFRLQDVPDFVSLPTNDTVLPVLSTISNGPLTNKEKVIRNSKTEEPNEDCIPGVVQTLTQHDNSNLFDTVLDAIPLVGEVASLVGFSKSTNQQADQPFFIRNPDISTTRGEFVGNKITLNPVNKVSIPSVMPYDANQYDLSYIASRPCLYSRILISPNVPAPYEIANYHLDPVEFALRGPSQNYYKEDETIVGSKVCHTFVSAVSALFKYYRGGIKIYVEVVMSKLTTFRYRLIYTPPLSASLPSNAEHDFCLSQVVECSGLTVSEFEMPYVGSTYALDDESFSLGILSIVGLNPPVSTAGNAPVYMNIYVAATEACEFIQPIDRINTNFFWGSSNAAVNVSKEEKVVRNSRIVDAPAAGELGQTGSKYSEKLLKRTKLPRTANIQHRAISSKKNETLVKERDPKRGEEFRSFQISKQHLVQTALNGEMCLSVKDLCQRMFPVETSNAFVIAPGIEDLWDIDGYYAHDMPAIPFWMWFALFFRFRVGGFNFYAPRLGTLDNLTVTMNGKGTNMFYKQRVNRNIDANYYYGTMLYPADVDHKARVKIPYVNNLPYVRNTISLGITNARTSPIGTQILVGAEEVALLAPADDFNFGLLLSPPAFIEAA